MVTYTQNLYSAFNPSKVHTHTHCVHTPGAVGSHIVAAPGEQLGVRCLAQGSDLSRGIADGESAGYSLQNLNGLIIETVYAFEGLKKECIFTIVGWLCPHTAKTHLYANEDILHPRSHLKLKYYHINSSDEGFRKSDSN